MRIDQHIYLKNTTLPSVALKNFRTLGSHVIRLLMLELHAHEYFENIRTQEALCSNTDVTLVAYNAGALFSTS